ncbi:MAG: hypothetical protein LBF05_05885 [Tannerella sp.]|jgi:hypothetical protein|nr:hypothetical protein [Tannerella sp.]
MTVLDKITGHQYIGVNGEKYRILGKAYYVTQRDPKTSYTKILLEGHHVLVVSPSDKIAYFGKNMGRLSEFDSFSAEVCFDGKIYKQVNHDYQIVTKIDFGSPLEVEGEVEFWDYETDDFIISIAVTSRNKERADVAARYIPFDEIVVV